MTDAKPNGVRRRSLGWAVAGILLLGLTWLITQISQWTAGQTDARQQLTLAALYGAAGVTFLVTIAAMWHGRERRRVILGIVIAGTLMRALAFAHPPQFETDFHRFLWDGAVTAHGYNPYAIRPQDVLVANAARLPVDEDFRLLASRGMPTVRAINHPHLSTIYPPVAEGLFAIAYLAKPFSVNALRGEYVIAEFALLLLMLQMLRSLGLPLHRVAIYWWNPIAIKEIYGSAHMDALVALVAFAAVCACVWRFRTMACVLLGVAIGIKLWPVVLVPIVVRFGAPSRLAVVKGATIVVGVALALTWPLLVRWVPAAETGIVAYQQQWVNNAGAYTAIEWAMHAWPGPREALLLHPHEAANVVVLCAMAVVCLLASFCQLRDASSVWGWSVACAGGAFLLIPTQFPWYYLWLLPFLVIAPSRALLLYSALLPLYHLQWDHPWVLWVEHVPVWLLIGWGAWRRLALSRGINAPFAGDDDYVPPVGVRVSVVIPALNEAEAIGQVVRAIPAWVTQVIVADNGSTDATASIARDAGASVVVEPRRGYGVACLAGLAALDRPDVVVFLDGDFSDQPGEMNRLVQPILRDDVDLVVGSRVLGNAAPGSLTLPQRFGNALACNLMRLIYSVDYTDLGPFRAIRASALKQLAMDDRDYGWTAQMQVRAAQYGLNVAEIPVSYRRRIGQSKISGTLRGVVGAGTKIIGTIARERFRARDEGRHGRRLIVMARFPEAGRAKTRMIPLLGPAGAARLHRQLVAITLDTARLVRRRTGATIEVRSTGASTRQMRTLFGTDVAFHDQGDGDLGKRLLTAAADAFATGEKQVVIVGTDCPLLSVDRVNEAFGALAMHDVVIGPAVDGGYYLIGLKAAHKKLFDGIDWGGPRVLAQTLDRCARAGLAYALISPLSDVDTADDLAAWATARLAPPDARPRLSVIIPSRNEQDELAATLASTLTASDIEIIVVDGNSSDRTREIAARFGVRVIESESSRGLQLNAGAHAARGERLLFQHADTHLPQGYAAVIERTLVTAGVSAGAFGMRIDATGFAPRIIEWGVRVRSLVFARPYGDQAMYMLRSTYVASSGFPNLARMEDYAMLPRLSALGQIRLAPLDVTTAARRWQEQGWICTTLRHQILIAQYSIGKLKCLLRTDRAYSRDGTGSRQAAPNAPR